MKPYQTWVYWFKQLQWARTYFRLHPSSANKERVDMAFHCWKVSKNHGYWKTPVLKREILAEILH